jgi:peptidoglycan/LPS O-acetylase OafA/YrhL
MLVLLVASHPPAAMMDPALAGSGAEAGDGQPAKRGDEALDTAAGTGSAEDRHAPCATSFAVAKPPPEAVAGTERLDFPRNYETVKLPVDHPDVHQLLIVLMSGALVWLLCHKAAPTPLFDRHQTEQLKGIGIFLVMLGHLWVHVSEERPLLVLSEAGVTIFLVLSGFGLTASSGNRCPDVRTFATRRLGRVMPPYWFATVVIIILDAVVLRRFLPPADLALTALGINLSQATRSLDYVRWFVTFVLLWYVLFYLAMFLKEKMGLSPLASLFTCGLAFHLFDSYVYGFAYQEFAFPAGCALAHYRDAIRSHFELHRGRWVLGAVVLLASGLLYRALMPVVYPRLWPMLFFQISFQAANLALTFGLIILLGRLGDGGRRSKALALLGALSYELFLMHGPLMIKYNPVFGLMPTALLPLGFLLLLGILLILSAGLRRALAKAAV